MISMINTIFKIILQYQFNTKNDFSQWNDLYSYRHDFDSQFGIQVTLIFLINNKTSFNIDTNSTIPLGMDWMNCGNEYKRGARVEKSSRPSAHLFVLRGEGGA